jgi:hypothetical protein
MSPLSPDLCFGYAQDESAKQGLALQRQTALATRLQSEREGEMERMKSLENELEHLNADYQEAQQMIERNQKAAHIESQRLKQVSPQPLCLSAKLYHPTKVSSSIPLKTKLTHPLCRAATR